MRLIDINTLTTTVVPTKYITGRRDTGWTEIKYVKNNNVQTVKAIPVEWLKTQIEKCQEISNTSKTVGLAILAETIKQWEKENGTEESTRNI